MNSFDKMNKGLCPNDCGEMTIFEKPVSKLLMIPEDLCDLGKLEGTETPMDMFGYIVAACSKCGFVLSTPPTWEYDYDEYKWVRISSEGKTE